MNIRKLLIFTIAFILFTPIGTVSHEYGHVIVAKYFGYETTLHYGSMNYDSGELKDRLDAIRTEFEKEIEAGADFEKRTEYERGVEKLRSNRLWITMGGPIQTILTGTIGLLILVYRKKKRKLGGLKMIDWLAIFLTLFWLREVFNLVMSVGRELIAPNGSWFGGDERKISLGLDLWAGTVPIIMGVIGFVISIFVIFRMVPKHLRFTFILSGLIGGIIGLVLWMDIIGPILLP